MCVCVSESYKCHRLSGNNWIQLRKGILRNDNVRRQLFPLATIDTTLLSTISISISISFRLIWFDLIRFDTIYSTQQYTHSLWKGHGDIFIILFDLEFLAISGTLLLVAFRRRTRHVVRLGLIVAISVDTGHCLILPDRVVAEYHRRHGVVYWIQVIHGKSAGKTNNAIEDKTQLCNNSLALVQRDTLVTTQAKRIS